MPSFTLMITKVGKMEIIPKIKELIAKPVNASRPSGRVLATSI